MDPDMTCPQCGAVEQAFRGTYNPRAENKPALLCLECQHIWYPPGSPLDCIGLRQ